jgi:hypothetical protein
VEPVTAGRFFLVHFECTGLRKEINWHVENICQQVGQNFGLTCANCHEIHIWDCVFRVVLEHGLMKSRPFQKMTGTTVRGETLSVAHASLGAVKIIFHFRRKKCKFTIV